MSLSTAISVMSKGNLIVHKDVAYAIIDERICFCRYSKETNTIEYHQEVETPMALFSMLFDTFVPIPDQTVFRRPSFPEFYVIEDGKLYDFGLLLEMTCPNCFTWCGKSTVIRVGRYAHCPGCNRQYWRASRADGVREVPLPKAADRKPPKPAKPEKPKPPSNEEIIASLLENPDRIIKRKISFKV